MPWATNQYIFGFPFPYVFTHYMTRRDSSETEVNVGHFGL